LYYVTKKGVRMAGMPAWEFRMSDEALWGTVAFLKAMPFMEAEEYERLASANSTLTCPPVSAAEPYSKELAQTVLRQYACHNCHLIDRVVGPDTYVGPPLHDWHKRKLIAGVAPNTTDELVRWIVDPQQVSPGTLMPNLGVSEAHARIMATYLLRERRP
jgi:cytochrome c2